MRVGPSRLIVAPWRTAFRPMSVPASTAAQDDLAVGLQAGVNRSARSGQANDQTGPRRYGLIAQPLGTSGGGCGRKDCIRRHAPARP